MPGSDFNFETVEFLDPSGQLKRPLPEALATRDKLVELYQLMVQTRVFDRAAINLQRTGAIGHLSLRGRPGGDRRRDWFGDA